jgi:hypothetical protein
MRDVLTDALNDPAGQLAGILLNKVGKEENGELPNDIRDRLDKLIGASGRPGKLARIRLAPEVPFLFDRAPNWTSRRLLPIFDWSTSSDALDAWSSRKYSKWIGSPELFGRLKQSFMEIFNRTDVLAEDLRIFGDWLAAILIANQADNANYPLTAIEARSALRRAGPEAMASVGHRLAGEMERAGEAEKRERWREIVGPVFKGIWPLDIDLQTSATTFKLVQLLRATCDAFPEAAETILPFVRPEGQNGHTTIFSLSQEPDAFYQIDPAKILDLLAAIVGDAEPGSVFSLGSALSRLQNIAPDLATTRKFQKLAIAASPHV